MRHPHHSASIASISIVAAALALPGITHWSGSGSILHAQAQAAAVRQAGPQAAPATDPGWPRVSSTQAGGRVRVYQPQVASWERQEHLVAYVAVAHTATADDAPVLGTMKVEADTAVSLEHRLVHFSTFKITETNFGAIQKQQVRQVLVDVERAMSEFDRVISLDRVLAGMDKSQIRPRNVEGVKADPPRVFYSTTPAVLVGFDGDPIWSPIKESDLKYAVNTNWDVFEHVPTKTFFLRDDLVWLKAAAVTGPWEPAGILPVSFSRLPPDENWRDVKASLPGRRIAASEIKTIFVSTVPAELILLRGAPNYLVVPGADNLLWVSNTESDLFRLGKAGPLYYLVAGRWFVAPDFNGPWKFATPSLPADFQRIGAEHPRARVLAAVPGTSQAAEAVLLAQVPQTARISKKSLQAPAVSYQGDPEFRPIEQTTLQRAVNTDKDVIRIGDLYYLCFQGVWFVSRSARGPWEVEGSVPAAIYSIPASSPIHHVTYVTVVESGADSVVFATAAGYTGVTIAWGCAVWGTGWYYPPYVGYGGYYPVYYPYYPTYGAAAWYNSWTGTYQRGAAAYGPYGGGGATALYNPATGTYARGAVAWGPYGANGAAQAYNPRTGTSAQTRQGAGVYGSWGSSYVQRGDDWAATSRVTNNVTGTTSRVTRTDDGGMVSRSGPNGGGFVAAGEEGVYAGRDGNVYRRGDGGGWQKYENGSWGETQRPADNAGARPRERAGAAEVPDRSTIGQLERDRSARIEGGQRAREGSIRGGGERPQRPNRPAGGGARPRGRAGR